jgi:hypothetical protein
MRSRCSLSVLRITNAVPEPLRVEHRSVMDCSRRLLPGGVLVEVGAQRLDGCASGQPGRLIEVARLAHAPVRDAGDAPRRLEVFAGKRSLRGMPAGHSGQSTTNARVMGSFLSGLDMESPRKRRSVCG